MPAPISNTCPDINAVMVDIEDQYISIDKLAGFIQEQHAIEPTSYNDEVIEILNDVALNLKPFFSNTLNPLEDLRTANDVLRRYGEEMEDENNVAEDKISELEQKIEDLEYLLNQANKKIVELENEVEGLHQNNAGADL